MGSLSDRYFLDEADETDLCDHEEYDMDILNGRAKCYSCGHTWYASEGEIALYIRAHTP